MPSTAHQITSYELLIARTSLILSSPRAQIQRHASIERLQHETDADWERFLDGLGAELTVTATRRADGGVDISWETPAI